MLLALIGLLHPAMASLHRASTGGLHGTAAPCLFLGRSLTPANVFKPRGSWSAAATACRRGPSADSGSPLGDTQLIRRALCHRKSAKDVGVQLEALANHTGRANSAGPWPAWEQPADARIQVVQLEYRQASWGR
jgi:hypothetical protein